MSINLSEVGANITQLSASSWQVQFGIYLPGITPADGYTLQARLIHEADQFTAGIAPVSVPLSYLGGANGLWQATTAISAAPGSNYGQPGQYLYRFQLLRYNDPVAFWFADPFARESGPAPFPRSRS